eukprot:gb/GECG01016582.1/.p1 GENE.gb/GECG01016582.1/~~gb/GECG01016582.1/.p1  ORF type:complete len:113 (+),score=9.22 gb/GECG01016582.1/:1-339(+)
MIQLLQLLRATDVLDYPTREICTRSRTQQADDAARLSKARWKDIHSSEFNFQHAGSYPTRRYWEVRRIEFRVLRPNKQFQRPNICKQIVAAIVVGTKAKAADRIQRYWESEE